ncbi:MAG TPA: CPXCG motif-containing cysteine-rich protein [Elusimicrobiota bacterium]|nr:CPXCG motif-containing cysteine-rich protein [Elusimicrobiota bacterium]
MPKRKVAKAEEAVKDREPEDVKDSELDSILAQTLKEDEARSERVLKWVEVECPYCGENFEVRVDPSEEGQEMVQDCQVCCKPIELSVESQDGEVEVLAYRG